jgi:hypothetical protein
MVGDRISPIVGLMSRVAAAEVGSKMKTASVACLEASSTSARGPYAEQRISGECCPDGLVITDLWDAAGYNGCTG